MLFIPQSGRIRIENNHGLVGANNPGTPVTTHATVTSTKGTPVELIASTLFDAYWIEVWAMNYSNPATASEGALDILIGTATAEVLIPNLLMGYCGGGNVAGRSMKNWGFPLYIPAGSRLSAQVAGLRLATSCIVGVILYGGDGYPKFRVGSHVLTYGMGTVPLGTTVTPGASGAEGTPTQIVAATTEDHFAILPSYQVTNDTTTNPRSIQVDALIGAATEELLGSWWFWTDANETMSGPHPTMPIFADILSGTRLVMRASNSGVNDAGYNGVFHCVS
jgi:hypothetical protein